MGNFNYYCFIISYLKISALLNIVLLFSQDKKSFSDFPKKFQKCQSSLNILHCTFPAVIAEADPQKFSIGFLEGPFRIGTPFQVPLEFQDAFGHVTEPDPQVAPLLEAT